QVPSSDATPDPLAVALALAAAADPLPHLPPSKANPSRSAPPPVAAAPATSRRGRRPSSSRGRRAQIQPRPLPCVPTTPSPAAAPQVHFACAPERTPLPCLRLPLLLFSATYLSPLSCASFLSAGAAMAASWSSPPWAACPSDDGLPRPRPGPLNPNLGVHLFCA
uniref:Uncharacterized protein n=1 Tax=Triticum urartu TaxID=4572 RepID=A0A8R7TFV8_TRIUA